MDDLAYNSITELWLRLYEVTVHLPLRIRDRDSQVVRTLLFLLKVGKVHLLQAKLLRSADTFRGYGLSLPLLTAFSQFFDHISNSLLDVDLLESSSLPFFRKRLDSRGGELAFDLVKLIVEGLDALANHLLLDGTELSCQVEQLVAIVVVFSALGLSD